jgi:hypothetical protein
MREMATHATVAGQGLGCLPQVAKKTCALGKAPETLLDITRLSEFSRGRDNSHGARSAHQIPPR